MKTDSYLGILTRSLSIIDKCAARDSTGGMSATHFGSRRRRRTLRGRTAQVSARRNRTRIRANARRGAPGWSEHRQRFAADWSCSRCPKRRCSSLGSCSEQSSAGRCANQFDFTLLTNQERDSRYPRPSNPICPTHVLSNWFACSHGAPQGNGTKSRPTRADHPARQVGRIRP
jgi:hypothetical protein